MGFKDFRDDIVAASLADPEKHVSRIRQGDSENELAFTYQHDALPAPINIKVFATDVALYPESCPFLIFTDSEHLPLRIDSALGDLGPRSEGKTAFELIQLVSKTLSGRLGAESDNGVDGNEDAASDSSGGETFDDSDYDPGYYDYEETDARGEPKVLPRRYSPPGSAAAFRESHGRLKKDLVAALRAGVTPGRLEEGKAGPNSIFSLSFEVSGLGIPAQTLEAWDLEPTDFIVLLMRFPTGYPSLSTFVNLGPEQDVARFRLGKCKGAKPSLATAKMAFEEREELWEEAAEAAETVTAPALSDDKQQSRADDFVPMYLFTPINDLLNKQLAGLVRVRREEEVSWDQAQEHLFNYSLTRVGVTLTKDQQAAMYQPQAHDSMITSHVAVPLQHDFALDDNADFNLTLVAMQFALRRLARCTKYCMVCHRNVADGHEAIKPYVCFSEDPDAPNLCFYQYLKLGFGPSIEHEIINHPYVVDLLINFFVAAIGKKNSREIQLTSTDEEGTNGKTKRKQTGAESPAGLGLSVPKTGTVEEPNKPILAEINFKTKQFRFAVDDFKRSMAIKPGTRVMMIPIDKGPPPEVHVLTVDTGASQRHICQITAVDLDVVSFEDLGPVVTQKVLRVADGEQIPLTVFDNQTVGWKPVAVYPFDGNIDDMQHEDAVDKEVAMLMLVNSIPSVLEMRSYLLGRSGRRLATWKRIDRATCMILNLIIASNRSYIVQDEPVTTGPQKDTDIKDVGHPQQPKIKGIGPGWMQFRFQQGSPEKERKFGLAMQLMKESPTNRAWPTLFAWHGSNLGSWHSIIRTGLDFAERVNGRSYGNGVYFSLNFSTSMTFSGGSPNYAWANSVVRPVTAISICEIVNRPDRFVSTDPHLVVSETDWIQCRYLLVRTHPTAAAAAEPFPRPTARACSGFVQQDPLRPLMNGGVRIEIPQVMNLANAKVADIKNSEQEVSTVQESSPRRSARLKEKLNFWKTDKGKAKTKGDSKQKIDAVSADEEEIVKALGLDDYQSDDNEEFLYVTSPKRRRDSTESSSGRPRKRNSLEAAHSTDTFSPPTPTELDTGLTAFVPGTLDWQSLPVIPPPSWISSSPAALRRLTHEIKDMHEMQSSTSQSDLGWYIDFGKLENVFQWIVELHSFPKDLPIGEDMTALDCQSIVLELRFGSAYPMSPPFVRVIKPMFVPFAQGGGGHITIGGAICSELLTNSGWTPVYTIDKVLLAVRMGLLDEVRPARLEKRQSGNNYSIGEAIDAYERAARSHGWTLPENFREMVTL